MFKKVRFGKFLEYYASEAITEKTETLDSESCGTSKFLML